jgi:type I restriction enzyme R subunit
MKPVNESVLEEAALEWFLALGYEEKFGPDIGPGEKLAERASYCDVVLRDRLTGALRRLNPNVAPEALEEAARKVLYLDGASLIAQNRDFHRMLVNGVEVETPREGGGVRPDLVRLLDPDDMDNNDWVAVSQFTVEEGQHNRRPDIVIFVNGLPLAVFELKDATNEDATIWSAFHQLQTYKQQIPSLFVYNEALAISDGLEARLGSLTANKERFTPWRTVEGEELAPPSMLQLEVFVKGVFEKRRFLDYVRHFIVYEEEKDGEIAKKMAGYHQFHAVRKALIATVEASRPEGDRRCGVIWHTQGSGKSLTMAFYAGKLVLAPEMRNPTLVVLTERNDLDDQLFGTFSRCWEILRQHPVQAGDRDELRQLLKRDSGGVIFTTIQKFLPAEPGATYPALSERSNIVVIADEAHRSQYDFIDGYARHMRDALPNASFIGFTGTPIELTDKNTRAVFGDYISIYDIQRAVQDGATVPIYYESRMARLELNEAERPKLDQEYEEVTESEEQSGKERLKSKWTALEALVGTEKRVGLIAQDLVAHFEKRLEAMEGKALIVCMSRRICVDLYNALVKLRPEWHSGEDAKGALKIVMTGNASDPLEWQDHVRNKPRREALAKRFKDDADPLKLVIVRDMWLTGFDAPCMHTMYIDKPMHGHGLMQAIARVNRVFRDKPGGLVVDYLGLADSLKQALSVYTESGGKGETAIDQDEAADVFRTKYEICRQFFFGFDWSKWIMGSAPEKLQLLPAAQEHVLKQEKGKDRYLQVVSDLTKAFALAVPHEAAMERRDDVGFFQAVRAALAKTGGGGGGWSDDDMEHAIRQLVSRAVAAEGVVDIFAAAGLKNPNIGILSDEFLAEVQGMPQRNLAVELLRKLLSDQIKLRQKKNVVQARSFAEMLEKSLRAYQNRALETVQIIQELIELAKHIRAADKRGEELGLSEDEVAFYDALGANDSAVQVLGEPTLQAIARELVDAVKRNVSIDWTEKESVRAKLRVIVKRILRRYGYPPDKQEAAAELVLQQAEVLSEAWAGN